VNNKLAYCRKCGAEIEKGASRCPACGVFRPSIVRYPVGGTTVVALCVILFCFAFFRFFDANEAEQPQEPAVIISATELWSAYQENGAKAESQYNDKLLAVSGEVFNITTFMGMQCVTLLVDNPTYCDGMICLFPKGEVDQSVIGLKDGDSVTIYGTCSGTEQNGMTIIVASPAAANSAYIYLNDCYFAQ